MLQGGFLETYETPLHTHLLVVTLLYILKCLYAQYMNFVLV